MMTLNIYLVRQVAGWASSKWIVQMNWESCKAYITLYNMSITCWVARWWANLPEDAKIWSRPAQHRLICPAAGNWATRWLRVSAVIWENQRRDKVFFFLSFGGCIIKRVVAHRLERVDVAGDVGGGLGLWAESCDMLGDVLCCCRFCARRRSPFLFDYFFKFFRASQGTFDWRLAECTFHSLSKWLFVIFANEISLYASFQDDHHPICWNGSADGNDYPLRLLRHTSNSIIIITFYLILEEQYTFFFCLFLRCFS